MGGSAGGKIVKQVPCDNEISIRAAGAPGRFFPERLGPAGPHGTPVAADSQLPESALRLLTGETIPDGLDAVFHSFYYNLLVCLVKRSRFSNFLSCR
jgi:hypothetical protein